MSRNGYEVEHICKDGKKVAEVVPFGSLKKCIQCGTVVNFAIPKPFTIPITNTQQK